MSGGDENALTRGRQTRKSATLQMPVPQTCLICFATGLWREKVFTCLRRCGARMASRCIKLVA
jgi:hypothetical protein